MFEPRWPRKFFLRQLQKRAVCAEVGVWRGDFSAQILEYTDPVVLHLVDPWRVADDQIHRAEWYSSAHTTQQKMDAMARSVMARFTDEITEGRVVVHRKASLDAATTFADASLDWVYIDGDHAYDGVMADLNAWAPKVRRGGFLAGDDYVSDRGTWLERLIARFAWYHDDVARAVDDFVASNDAQLLMVQRGQFLVRLP